MVEYNIVKQIKHPKKISSITLIHKTVVLSHIPQKLLTIQNQLLTHTNQSVSIYHNSALLKTIELEINDVKCLKKQLVIADRSGAIIMKDYFLDTIWKFKYSNSCCPLVLFDHFVLSLVKDQVLFVHSGDLIKVITMDGYCVGGCAGNFTAKKNVDMDVDLGSSQIDDTESIASFNSFSSSVINSDPPKEIIIILQDALYLINDDALSTNEYIPKLYIDLDFFVTKVYAFRPSWLDHDLLITTGHFCGIRIYDQNQIYFEYEGHDWVKDVQFLDHDRLTNGADRLSTIDTVQGELSSIGELSRLKDGTKIVNVCTDQLVLLFDNSEIQIVELFQPN